MTSAPDRKEIVALVTEALGAGARQAAACAELGLDPRSLQRWKGPDGALREDGRPDAVRPVPSNRLTEAERDEIVATCNAPEFASLPPSQIVPRLADAGIYIASESSMYRVLRERGQNHRRGRARPVEAACELPGEGVLPGLVPGHHLVARGLVAGTVFSTSISSSTSSAGRSSAGRSATGRRPSSQPGCSSAPSWRRGASPARWCCTPTTAAR